MTPDEAAHRRLITRRNGWCLGKLPGRHADCPQTWGRYPGDAIAYYACDCSCHSTPAERGELW